MSNKIYLQNTTIFDFVRDQNSIKTFQASPQYCLFEDHTFNTTTKRWDPISPGKELRKCTHSKCTRKHKLKRASQVCPREIDCPTAGTTCLLLHDNIKLKPLCHWGSACIDLNCLKYRHPDERSKEVCPLNDKCINALITCFKLHTMSALIPLCHYMENCVNYICSKRHPPSRKELCAEGSMCWNFIVEGEKCCSKLHPKILQKACRWNMNCREYGCPYIHQAGAPVDCVEGIRCLRRSSNIPEKRCMNKHPECDIVDRNWRN